MLESNPLKPTMLVEGLAVFGGDGPLRPPDAAGPVAREAAGDL